MWLAADDGEPLRTSGDFWLDRRRRTIHRLPSTRRSDTPERDAAVGLVRRTTPGRTSVDDGLGAASSNCRRRLGYLRTHLRARPRTSPRRGAVRGRSSARRPFEHDRRRRSWCGTTRCRHGLHRPQRSQLPEPGSSVQRARRLHGRHRNELRSHRSRSGLAHGRVHLPGHEPEHVVRRSPQPGRTRRCGSCWRTSRRFYRHARQFLDQPDPSISLDQFLDASRFSRDFVELHLRPLGAAVWSADPSTFGEFPGGDAADVLEESRPAGNHGSTAVAHDPWWQPNLRRRDRFEVRRPDSPGVSGLRVSSVRKSAR